MSEPVPTVADLVGLTIDDLDGPAGVATGVAFDTLRRTLEEDLVTGFPDGRAARLMDLLAATMAIPVPDMLMASWRKYREVLAYADPKLHPPGKTEEIPLVDQAFDWAWTPAIDVLIEERPFMTFDFRVTLELKLAGGILVIRDGRVLAIGSGECAATGAVFLEDRRLIEKKLPKRAIPGRIDLGAGIPIDPLAPARPRVPA
jgi:hypothetical protein